LIILLKGTLNQNLNAMECQQTRRLLIKIQAVALKITPYKTMWRKKEKMLKSYILWVMLRVYTRLDLLVLRKGVVRTIGVTVGVSSL
jgi:hypothetical protein